jgi:hypothetical protein
MLGLGTWYGEEEEEEEEDAALGIAALLQSEMR